MTIKRARTFASDVCMQARKTKDLDVRIELKTDPGAAGARVVPQDVAFTVKARAFGPLFGSAGANKTTTLRIAMELERNVHGSLRRPDGRFEIMVQGPGLRPSRAVADNPRLTIAKDGPPRDFLTSPVAPSLSGVGMCYAKEQPLGMARSAALTPMLAVAPQLPASTKHWHRLLRDLALSCRPSSWQTALGRRA